MAKLGDISVELTAVTGVFLTKMKESTGALDRVADQAKKIAAPLAAASAAFAAMGAVVVKTGAEFEKSMARVGALTGSVGEGFKALENRAIEMAGATEFTGREVASAMQFMAMAGQDATTIMKAIPKVLELATSGAVDLGIAADIATNIMAGFGKGASEMGEVNDALTATFTNSNTSLTELGDTMKFVAPVANAAGFSLEEMSAAAGLLGNVGIKGTLAGTSLRFAITSLLKPSKEATETLEELGVSVRNSEGNLESMATIMDRLKKSGAGVEEVMKIFGVRAGSSMAALLDVGGEALAKFTRKLENSGGVAKEIEQRQLNTLSGQFNILRSQVEAVAIEITRTLMPAFRAIVGALQGLVRGFMDLPTPLRDLAILMTAAAGVTVILTTKIVLLILAFKGLAIVVGGVQSAMKVGFIAVMVKAALALGVFVATFKVVQAMFGTNTPLIKTAKDTWDRMTESVHALKMTMINFVITIGDLILRFLSLLAIVGFFPSVQRAITRSMVALSGSFSDASFEAAEFGERVKTATRLMQDLPSKAIQFKVVIDKADAKTAAMKFREAVEEELKSRQEARMKAKVSAVVDKIELEKGITAPEILDLRANENDVSRFFDALKNKMKELKIKLQPELDLRGIKDPTLEQLLSIDTELMQKENKKLALSVNETTGKLATAFGTLSQAGRSAEAALGILTERSKKAAEEVPKLSLSEVIGKFFRNQLNELTKATGTRVPKEARDAVEKGITGIAEAIFSGKGGLLDAAKSALSGILDAAGVAAGLPPGVGTAAVSAVEGAVGMVTGVFEAIGGEIKSTGKKLVDGLVSIIGDDRLTGAINFATDVFQSAFGAAKRVGGALIGAAPVIIVFAALLSGVISMLIFFSPILLGLAASAAVTIAAFSLLGFLILQSMGIWVSTLITINQIITTISAAATSFVTSIAGLAAAGGLVAAFAFLATKTKSLGVLQEFLSESTDRLVQVMEPLFSGLWPLAALFDSLVTALLPIGAQLAQLTRVFEDEIFIAAKFLALSFVNLAIAGFKTANQLITGAQKLLSGVAWVLGGLGEIMDKLKIDNELGEMAEGLSNVVSALDEFKMSTEGMEEAMSDLAGLTLKEAKRRIHERRKREKDEAVERAKNKLKDQLGIDSANEASGAAKGLAASLSNVPDIIKVAAARFNAADPLGTGGTGSTTPDGALRVDEGWLDKLDLVLSNWTDTLADRLGLVGGGSRSFDLNADLEREVGARDANVLVIENLHAFDPEDMTTKVEEHMQARGFERMDSAASMIGSFQRRRR